MKIYFNGDSHTCGSELSEHTAYSYVMAKKLHAQVMDNPAQGGVGNDRIYRLTNQFLDKCEQDNSFPDLVVIGWSECSRNEWFHDGSYRTLNSSELPRELAEKIDPNRVEYYNSILTGPLAQVGILLHQHCVMYNLHLRLEYLKIPHLFFNACHSFSTVTNRIRNRITTDQMDALIKFEWNNSFWKPYDERGSFFEWGSDNNYPFTKYFHLNTEAHEHYADVLIEYMKEHKII